MKLIIEFKREDNSHVVKAEDGEAFKTIAHIYGWVAGGIPSLKIPYFVPMDAVREIENVVQREAQGPKTGKITIDTGGAK